MEPIFFILKKRSQLFFDKENNAEYMLTLLSIVGYLYIPHLLGKAFHLENSELPMPILILFTQFILFAPLLSLFFPAFVAKRNILPAYLPLAKYKLFLLDFISSIGRRASLSIVAMTIGFVYNFHAANSLALSIIILAGLNALLFTDAIVNIISFQKHRWWTLITLAVALNILPRWLQEGQTLLLSLQIFSLVILSYTVWTTYSVLFPKKRNKGTTIRPGNQQFTSLVFKEISRNAMAKKAVLLILIIKALLLFIRPYLTGKYTAGAALQPLDLLILSPLLIFTSIFNNSFGYFRNLYFNIWLFNDRPGQYLQVFGTLLMPLMVTDAIISLSYLLWFDLFSWQNIAFYFTAAIYLMLIAIITSCLLPKKVEDQSLSSIKKGTSTWASILSMLPFILISVLHQSRAYLTLLISLAIALVALIVYMKTRGQRWQLSVTKALK